MLLPPPTLLVSKSPKQTKHGWQARVRAPHTRLVVGLRALCRQCCSRATTILRGKLAAAEANDDMLANQHVVDGGFVFPRWSFGVQVAACFGGPTLNTLIGIGLAATVVTARAMEPYVRFPCIPCRTTLVKVCGWWWRGWWW